MTSALIDYVLIDNKSNKSFSENQELRKAWFCDDFLVFAPVFYTQNRI